MVKCLRLTRSTLDLCNHGHLQQAVDQAAELEGADAWISIEQGVEQTHEKPPILHVMLHVLVYSVSRAHFGICRLTVWLKKW